MTSHGSYDVSSSPGYLPHPYFEPDGTRRSVESQIKAKAEIAVKIAILQQQQGSPAQVQQQPVQNLGQQQARMEEVD